MFVNRPARFAIVGDVLFAGSIGRTDFPYGDHAALIRAIEEKLLPLGDDFSFICGHGPGSTIGAERVHRGSESAITLLPQRLKLAQRSSPMPTQCSRDLFGFAPVEGRRVEAAFDGGRCTSDAGALLLGATDRAIGLVQRFAACFDDGRTQGQVEHTIETMVAQRVFGIALGYEDLVDHDQLRHDPVLATLAGKLEAKRRNCAPLAGKSTLNRLEHAPIGALALPQDRP